MTRNKCHTRQECTTAGTREVGQPFGARSAAAVGGQKPALRRLWMAAVSTCWAALAAGCGPSGFVERWSVATPAESTRAEGLPAAGNESPIDAPPLPPPADAIAPATEVESRPGPQVDARVEDALEVSEVRPGPADVGPPDAAREDGPVDGSSTLEPPASLAVQWGPSQDVSDLTQIGTGDWIHWGYQPGRLVNRKRGVPSRIAWLLVQAAGVGRYDDRQPAFTWSDGTPTRTARTHAGGVVGGTIGAGFQLQVPGPLPGPARLTVYVGAWNARGVLRVWIDGQPASTSEDRDLSARDSGRDRIATVDFGPLGPGQTLVLEWRVAAFFHSYGNVTLQAAAYSALPGDDS
jgi:hypothetical protein